MKTSSGQKKVCKTVQAAEHTRKNLKHCQTKRLYFTAKYTATGRRAKLSFDEKKYVCMSKLITGWLINYPAIYMSEQSNKRF